MATPIIFKLQRKWNAGDDEFGGVPPFMAARAPMPIQPAIFITGVTRDKTGAVLGSCVVHLFRTDSDLIVQATTSDGSGNYTFSMVGLGTKYYVVAYLPGSPDLAGTTVNTLVGV